MSLGKGIRHTMGCAPLMFEEDCAALGCCNNFRDMAVGPGSTTPPHIYIEASWYPSTIGRSRTNSYICVGRFATSSASHLKSYKASWTTVYRVTLFHLTWQRDSCIWLKNPLALGRASAIERSLQRARCHLSMPTLCWVRGMDETISLSRAMQWGRRVIVMLTESTIHPSTVWYVDHEQSPASSFLSERTSLQFLVSCQSRGWNTLSSAWKSVRRTWLRRCCCPCASTRKSSTNTST